MEQEPVTMASWRPLPPLTEENRFFWTGGVDGRLRFQHCPACDYFIHPPAPVCPKCLTDRLAPKPVSGHATIRSVTINHQPWGPGLPVPYAIAIVGLDEQEDLNLTTNIVGIAAEEVRIGMTVEVTFEVRGDIHIPLFRPASTSQ
jgi:uncharacterized OB-fold protein